MISVCTELCRVLLPAQHSDIRCYRNIEAQGGKAWHQNKNIIKKIQGDMNHLVVHSKSDVLYAHGDEKHDGVQGVGLQN